MHSRDVDVALQYTDVSQAVREWTVPHLDVAIDDDHRSVLVALADADGEASIPELDEVLEKSKSTLSRRISDLEDDGLVETWMDGKTKVASLTFSGELQLRR